MRSGRRRAARLLVALGLDDDREHEGAQGVAQLLVWHADRILVMNEGRLIEQGTHAELSARAAVYAELVASQLE